MAKAKTKKPTKSVTVSKAKPASKAVKTALPAKAPAAAKPAAAAKSAAPVKPVAAAKSAVSAKPAAEKPTTVAAKSAKMTKNQALKMDVEGRSGTTKVSIKTAPAPDPMAAGGAGAAAPVKSAKKGRSAKAEAAANEKSSQLSQKWSALYRKAQETQAPPYNMRQSYEAKTPIMHKLLGWGYILTNKNDRLEVLFKDGIRYLISNYKT